MQHNLAQVSDLPSRQVQSQPFCRLWRLQNLSARPYLQRMKITLEELMTYVCTYWTFASLEISVCLTTSARTTHSSATKALRTQSLKLCTCLYRCVTSRHRFGSRSRLEMLMASITYNHHLTSKISFHTNGLRTQRTLPRTPSPEQVIRKSALIPNHPAKWNTPCPACKRTKTIMLHDLTLMTVSTAFFLLGCGGGYQIRRQP